MRHLVYLFPLFMSMAACSTQTAEVVAPTTPEVTTPQKQEAPRLTSCITLDDLDPSIRSRTTDAFTLYRDQVKYKNYPKAKDLWREAFYTAPGANGRASYHFDDGVKIYYNLFREATTQDRQGIVDTVLAIYDKRIECFGDDGKILARKAFDCYYNYRDYTNSDEVFEMFKEVVDRKGENADYFMVNPFSRMLYDQVLDEKISHAEASQYAYQIFDIIDFGEANCEDKYCDAWEVIREYSPELLSGLEGLRGFYNCDYYMDKYYDQFESDTTDCDNITEVYLKLVWANCDREEARFVRVKEAKEKECYVPPPPPGPLKIASQALNEGRFEEAISSYQTYVDEEEDRIKKANILLRISKIYYVHIKNFVASRKFALMAAEQRPDWGDPYILIGKLYASSGPLCGPGRGWDSQVVTWAAIDKFRYAKKIDPAVSDEANEWITRYRQYMPDREAIFLRQLNEGDAFIVPCWIQERTSIRAAP
ncbi:MAG: hypothetical protein AAFR14_02645 [Bacteroidota bacterium]